MTILVALSAEVTRFERLKNDYESCLDFREIFKLLADGIVHKRDDFFLQDGYLFKANKLCILRNSIRYFIVWELHAGRISGHFGRDKIIVVVEKSFF